MIKIIRDMLRKETAFTAIKVSIAVGTCLNIINQGPILFYGGDFSFLKAAMNYTVPFLVSSYSGAKARQQAVGE